jgi:hypothetical protein
VLQQVIALAGPEGPFAGTGDRDRVEADSSHAEYRCVQWQNVKLPPFFSGVASKLGSRSRDNQKSDIEIQYLMGHSAMSNRIRSAYPNTIK